MRMDALRLPEVAGKESRYFRRMTVCASAFRQAVWRCDRKERESSLRPAFGNSTPRQADDCWCILPGGARALERCFTVLLTIKSGERMAVAREVMKLCSHPKEPDGQTDVPFCFALFSCHEAPYLSLLAGSFWCLSWLAC